MDDFDKVMKYIEDHQDQYVKELIPWIQQPSVAITHNGIDKMAQLVKKAMKDVGAKAELYHPPVEKGSPVVYGELPAEKDSDEKKTLLMGGMYDVQDVEYPDLWEAPAWEGRIVDDRIIGRGSINSKSQLLGKYKSIEAIKAVTGDHPVNYILWCQGDEEYGSLSVPPFVDAYEDKLRKADAGFGQSVCPIGESQQEIVIGTRDGVSFDLEVKLRDKALHGATSCWIYNPAWRLISCLASMKNYDGDVTIEGFYDDVVLTEKDEALLKKRAEMLDEEAYRKSLGVDKFIKDLHGWELIKYAYTMPTFNITGMVSGSMTITSLNPAWAKAHIHIRMTPNMDGHDIVEKIQRHIKKHGFDDVTMDVHSIGRWSRTADPDDDIVRAVVTADERLGVKAYVVPIKTGCGPSHVFERFNIPRVHIHPGGEAPRAHGVNEYIEIESYIKTIKQCAAVIMEYGRITNAE